jgi:hypothetical protein
MYHLEVLKSRVNLVFSFTFLLSSVYPVAMCFKDLSNGVVELYKLSISQ